MFIGDGAKLVHNTFNLAIMADFIDKLDMIAKKVVTGKYKELCWNY
jgi:ATP-dependent 26S proteasome regulatory subunit